jgi:hypothetical protein
MDIAECQHRIGCPVWRKASAGARADRECYVAVRFGVIDEGGLVSIDVRLRIGGRGRIDMPRIELAAAGLEPGAEDRCVPAAARRDFYNRVVGSCRRS